MVGADAGVDSNRRPDEEGIKTADTGRGIVAGLIPTADLMKKGLRPYAYPLSTPAREIPTADLMKKGLRRYILVHLAEGRKFQPQT